MILLVFVAAVLVSGIFERQARRHRYELDMEHERLGIPTPLPRPKLKRTEAWMNVGIGILLVLLSIYSIQGGIGYMKFAENAAREHRPAMASTFNEAVAPMFMTGAFFLASGIALVWLGWKAVREITRFESGASGTPALSESADNSGEHAFTRRPPRFTLTAAIAAGAFVAGILTCYLFLSRTPSSSPAPGALKATVSIEMQSGDDAGIPPGFSDELSRRVTEQLGSLQGVSVVEGPGADYSFKAILTRGNGATVITWNVIRTSDHAVYFNRTFSIPVEKPGISIQTMISSLTTTFGEKRTTAEFERILQLPEHSLD